MPYSRWRARKSEAMRRIIHPVADIDVPQHQVLVDWDALQRPSHGCRAWCCREGHDAAGRTSSLPISNLYPQQITHVPRRIFYLLQDELESTVLKIAELD